MSALARGDRVITPMNEEARVTLVREDGRYELDYEGALIREHGVVVLPEKLLRKWVPGQKKPAPVKVEK